MYILWDIDQFVGDTAVHRDKMKSGHLSVSLAALSAPSHIPERNSPNLSVTMNKLAETLKTVSKDKLHSLVAKTLWSVCLQKSKTQY